MNCKKCNHKMIRTSDFTYEEIMNFIGGEREFYALVLIEKEKTFWKEANIKKSINFRKIEEIDGEKIKLFGLKVPLIDGKGVIEREIQKITYSLLEITDQVVDIIKDYMETQDEKNLFQYKIEQLPMEEVIFKKPL